MWSLSPSATSLWVSVLSCPHWYLKMSQWRLLNELWFLMFLYFIYYKERNYEQFLWYHLPVWHSFTLSGNVNRFLANTGFPIGLKKVFPFLKWGKGLVKERAEWGGKERKKKKSFAFISLLLLTISSEISNGIECILTLPH